MGTAPAPPKAVGGYTKSTLTVLASTAETAPAVAAGGGVNRNDGSATASGGGGRNFRGGGGSSVGGASQSGNGDGSGGGGSSRNKGCGPRYLTGPTSTSFPRGPFREDAATRQPRPASSMQQVGGNEQRLCGGEQA
eukprot:g16639.t1